MANRIKQLRVTHGLSQQRLAERLHTGRSQIAKLESGERRLTEDWMRRIAAVLECGPADLLVESPGSNRRSRRNREEGFVEIIELDIQASAGAGAIIEYEDELHRWRFPEFWLRRELDAPPESLYLITIQGDSMSGVVEPGDKALVNVADRRPTPPGVFIIHDGLGLVAKRIEYIDHSDPPRIRIMSTNPAYRDYERTLEEAHIVGRVVARWQRI